MQFSKIIIPLIIIFILSALVSGDIWTDMDKALKDAKKNLDDFGRNQAGPALAQARESFDKLSREKINPAIAEAGKVIDTFAREQLGPSLAGTGKTLDVYREERVSPALAQAVNALERFGRDKAIPVLAEAGNALDLLARQEIHPALMICNSMILQPALLATAEVSSEIFESLPANIRHDLLKVRDQLYQIDLTTIPNDIMKWIEKHPVQAGLYITSGILIIAPGLITGPILWGFGLTSKGPQAASIASALQGTMGNVPAGSIFAHLQSAAMGGYGVETVFTTARVAASVIGGVGIALEIEKMYKEDSMAPATIGEAQKIEREPMHVIEKSKL